MFVQVYIVNFQNLVHLFRKQGAPKVILKAQYRLIVLKCCYSVSPGHHMEPLYTNIFRPGSATVPSILCYSASSSFLVLLSVCVPTQWCLHCTEKIRTCFSGWQRLPTTVSEKPVFFRVSSRITVARCAAIIPGFAV